MKRYYLHEGGTLITLTSNNSSDFQNEADWFTHLRESPNVLKVSTALEKELSDKNLSDGCEVLAKLFIPAAVSNTEEDILSIS